MINKIKKISLLALPILCFIAFTTGCVHKMDIQQGNIINSQQVNQLHKGLTPSQVQSIMGTPVTINTFSNNRMEYVYTFQSGRGKRIQKMVLLIFNNDRLEQINKHL